MILDIVDKELITSFYYYVPKILISTFCGIIIGAEREFRQKPAGLRTMVLICTGCTLLTALAIQMSGEYHISDPSRMIGQIITGIGFLGGGVIMKTDDKIIGVTTASFIWVISSIGIMIGLGGNLSPILLTIGLLIISLVLEKGESTIKKLVAKSSKK